jgi:O-antigen ligase
MSENGGMGARHIWSERLGIAGVMTLAFSLFSARAGITIGLLLMVIGCALSPQRPWQVLWRDPMGKLVTVLALYLGARAIVAGWQFPGTWEAQLDDTKKWLYLCLFPLVAWWLRGDRRLILLALALALVSLLVEAIRHNDWGHCDGLFDGKRCGYGFQMIFMGLLCATSLLGLLLLKPRMPQARRYVRYASYMAWTILLLVLAQGFIASQSRATWAAAALVAPVILLLRYWTEVRDILQRRDLRRIATVTLVAALLFAVGMINNVMSAKRLGAEHEALKAAIQLQSKRVGSRSVGVRYKLAFIAAHLWWDRPIFGWGPSMRTSNTKYFRSYMHGMKYKGHFHNTYLEVLVRLGLMGAVLIFAIPWLLVSRLRGAFRTGAVEPDIYYFLAGSLGLLAIWSFFDFQVLLADWWHYWWLLAGATHSFAYAKDPVTVHH